ncbi:MAG: hypothetical protein IPO90_07125 [Flavobacteriales bacterium]|nr:hypothetical protein [Flavobacteriales bacterium]MBL0043454.1 hypothetical protein [Flavobacteriales bacterium]
MKSIVVGNVVQRLIQPVDRYLTRHDHITRPQEQPHDHRHAIKAVK